MRSHICTRRFGGNFILFSTAFFVGFGVARIAIADPLYTLQAFQLPGPGYSPPTEGLTYENSFIRLPVDGIIAGGSGTYASTDTGLVGLANLAWIYSGGNYTVLGLSGPGYQYTNAAGTVSSSFVDLVIGPNQIVGESARYDASGNSLGNDEWFYNGSTYQLLGFTGAGYSYMTAAGTHESSTLAATNSVGGFDGGSARFAASGAGLGNDAWVYNDGTLHQIGFTGAGYSYQTSNGIYEYSSTPYFDNTNHSLNDAGDAIGYSDRYASTGSSLGEDAWFYNGTATIQIGLTGAPYSYTNTSGGTVESSSPLLLSADGQVVGTSQRYYAANHAPAGSDAWIYNGSSTIPIGLTGPNYSYTVVAGGTANQNNQPFRLSDNGNVFGYATRQNSLGAPLGQDSWVYNGSSTVQVGLVGGNYSYTDSNGAHQNSSGAPGAPINNAGQAAGGSQRYTSNGTLLGEDSWFYNGASTQQIGMTGAGYSYAAPGGTFQSSFAQSLNQAGQVDGWSNRYDSAGNSLGQDSWFFDNKTDTTYPLRFSTNSATGYSFSQTEDLTDTGVALGTYELFDGSVDEGSQVFYWSETYGFRDLGSLVEGGLSAAGWASLADTNGNFPASFGVNSVFSGSTADGSPMYIGAEGVRIGDPAGDTTAYLLTAVVPEPMTLAPLALLALLLWHRPHRRTVL